MGNYFYGTAIVQILHIAVNTGCYRAFMRKTPERYPLYAAMDKDSFRGVRRIVWLPGGYSSPPDFRDFRMTSTEGGGLRSSGIIGLTEPFFGFFASRAGLFLLISYSFVFYYHWILTMNSVYVKVQVI